MTAGFKALFDILTEVLLLNSEILRFL